MLLETMGYEETREGRELSVRIIEHYDLFLGHYFDVLVTDVKPIQVGRDQNRHIFATRHQRFQNPHHLGMDQLREELLSSEDFPMPPPRD